jgi:hypothetical protein
MVGLVRCEGKNDCEKQGVRGSMNEEVSLDFIGCELKVLFS